MSRSNREKHIDLWSGVAVENAEGSGGSTGKGQALNPLLLPVVKMEDDKEKEEKKQWEFSLLPLILQQYAREIKLGSNSQEPRKYQNEDPRVK